MVLQPEAVELPRSKLLPSHGMAGHVDQFDDFCEGGFSCDGLQSRLTKKKTRKTHSGLFGGSLTLANLEENRHEFINKEYISATRAYA